MLQLFMSANQTGKIADLSPASKKDLTLVFEVHEVLERQQVEGKEAVLCRVVDETGIITAYFDQYANKFTVGTVFQMQNFRCKVVDHHLRLQMIKTTVVAKQPLKMGFKDLQNDLSAKFYVTANKNPQEAKNENQETIKKQQIKVEKQQEASRQDGEKGGKERRNDDSKGIKEKKEKQVSKGQQKIEPKLSDHEDTKRGDTKEERKQKKYLQRSQKTPKEQQLRQEPAKRLYKQKTEQSQKYRRNGQKEHQTNKQKPNESKKHKYSPKCQEIRVADCPDFQEKEATFIVRVNLNKAIKRQNYWMCKVSDLSGSTYFQFQPETGEALQDKSWYRLVAFKVFKDRDYGFIATQQKHSSFELLPDWKGKFEANLIWP